MRRERFANAASSTLTVTITSTDTSLTLADASKFPPTGNFVILIDSEIMLVTARSTNTLTVVRGQEGTTAAGHVTGAVAAQIVTVGNLHRFLADSVPGADGSKPPFRLVDASGNTLTSASFTSVNLADSVVTDQNGTIALRMLAGGASAKVTALARSAPATPNELIVGLQFIYPVSSSGVLPHCVVGFRESSTGKMLVAALHNQGVTGGYISACYRYDSPTSINVGVTAKNTFAMADNVAWFRVTDDGINLKLYLGDGWEWIQIYSEARTAFMVGGADQVIWGADVGGNLYDSITRLVAWSEP